MALAQVLLGLAPITFFWCKKLCDHCEHDPFFLKFQSRFWTSRFVRLVQKKWNELETDFKQFQTVTFFPQKVLLFVANYCFELKYAMIVNMTLFFSNFGHVFELPESLDWFKKNETNLKQVWNNFKQSLFFLQKVLLFVANYCFALAFIQLIWLTIH